MIIKAEPGLVGGEPSLSWGATPDGVIVLVIEGGGVKLFVALSHVEAADLAVTAGYMCKKTQVERAATEPPASSNGSKVVRLFKPDGSPA